MRILVDTNILISAILFPKSLVAKALLYITDNHSIVFCDQNISELREVLRRKKPDKLPDAEVLLAELSYELIPASYHAEKLIRDAKDQPILNAAIIADALEEKPGCFDQLRRQRNEISKIQLLCADDHNCSADIEN